ncbi:MAG: TonB-dependent receptor, partial [Desulfobacterales bacterium]|nr:TonB-dependent receptor [Desulfobacterales bacterium]
EAPAAVFVITNEDIRRSGVTNIPDALRMAPGIHVARINASSWAITARGFNRYFSNKLLVMIDGRTVYSPLYSGVYWSAQDVLLEDIDRIEVIRGPGASLWGANAVNGVINIITKSSRDTVGGLVVAGAGTEERGFGAVRYGTRVGKNAHVRAYAKYFDRDAGGDFGGIEANDDWRKFHTGFRADARPSAVDSLTLQGDVFGGDTGMTHRSAGRTASSEVLAPGEGDLAGGHLLARWKHSFATSGDLALQMYYDRTDIENLLIDEVRDTLDIDFQHDFAIAERHEFLWGLEYRWTRDEQGAARIIEYDPPERTLDLFSLFIQDRITLVENRLWLTIGARFENGYYTDWEVQPTGRLSWRPLEAHTFWAAVSRAVRTPSRMDKDGRHPDMVAPPGSPGNPSSLPFIIRIVGSDVFESETLTAYEAGWRFQPSERLFCDLTLFYNDYRDLRVMEMTGPPSLDPGPPPALVTTMMLQNNADVRTRGVELAVTWSPLEWWRLQFEYGWFGVTQSDNAMDVKGSSPEHQLGLRSSMDLPWNLELDVWPRHVDELSSLGVDSYTSLDIRLGWRPTEDLEFSLVGQNLLEKERAEFQDMHSPLISTTVERGVYGKITWRF